jgi:hypothetical protein
VQRDGKITTLEKEPKGTRLHQADLETEIATMQYRITTMGKELKAAKIASSETDGTYKPMYGGARCKPLWAGRDSSNSYAPGLESSANIRSHEV